MPKKGKASRPDKLLDMRRKVKFADDAVRQDRKKEATARKKKKRDS